MKIYAYEVRQDEMDYFKEYEKKYGVSVVPASNKIESKNGVGSSFVSNIK